MRCAQATITLRFANSHASPASGTSYSNPFGSRLMFAILLRHTLLKLNSFLLYRLHSLQVAIHIRIDGIHNSSHDHLCSDPEPDTLKKCRKSQFSLTLRTSRGKISTPRHPPSKLHLSSLPLHRHFFVCSWTYMHLCILQCIVHCFRNRPAIAQKLVLQGIHTVEGAP